MGKRKRMYRGKRRRPVSPRVHRKPELAKRAEEAKVDEEVSVEDMSTAEIANKLNQQQMLFCEYFVATRDMITSYMNAYPNVKRESARVSAHRLMRNEYIVEYINRLVREYGPAIRLSMNEIMAEVERIAMDEDITNAQKLKALKLLGQSYGEFSDKVEVTKTEFVIDVIDE